ncbi:small ribosomal subunit protein mS34 [Dermacentor albipictus]|uniref:small ribosomal subunit protein mS34 n=1 Tax=Dermacentor albipictus TaxID=60249 RepID=UPI0031FC2233
MPRIKYIGYPSPYVGKHLLWLLGNLKNFGVGRVVTRTGFERYPEPSYYVITKVVPYMDDANQYGDVWAETVYRGRRIGVVQLESPQVPDYKLVPKSEEGRLLSLPVADPVPKVLPRYLKMPPLMRIVAERDLKAKGIGDAEPKLQAVYTSSYLMTYRIAEEGEAPDVEHTDMRDYIAEKFRQGIKEI